MAETALFRKQHRRILALASKLAKKLRPDELKESPMEARLIVSELAGILSVHLTMEDDWLYPALADHERPDVVELAHKYVDEMGGLRDEFTAYAKEWTRPGAIQNDPHAFARATNIAVNKLTNRIYREDNELYSLVDKLSLKPIDR